MQNVTALKAMAGEATSHGSEKITTQRLSHATCLVKCSCCKSYIYHPDAGGISCNCSTSQKYFAVLELVFSLIF